MQFWADIDEMMRIEQNNLNFGKGIGHYFERKSAEMPWKIGSLCIEEGMGRGEWQL